MRKQLAIKQKELDSAAMESKLFRETLESMKKLNGQLQDEMSINQKTGERLLALRKSLLDCLAALKHHTDALTGTLSCLSCLEFLKCGPGTGMPLPLTLLCGHSICAKCFRTHSDPKSAESLVFCEECKIETKNKSLRESKVVGDLCSAFGKILLCVDDLRQAAVAQSGTAK